MDWREQSESYVLWEKEFNKRGNLEADYMARAKLRMSAQTPAIVSSNEDEALVQAPATVLVAALYLIYVMWDTGPGGYAMAR